MKMIVPLALLFAPIVSAAPAFAQSSTSSSPEDRQRFVNVVHNLERTPLNPALKEDLSWAIGWLTDAPDVTVTVCFDPLGGVSEKNFKHTPEIVVQYTLAMAAFVIENPGKSNDADAQQLAGVESALTAYRSILAVRPDDKSPDLDKLLGMRDRGELPAFVQKAFLRCKQKNR